MVTTAGILMTAAAARGRRWPDLLRGQLSDPDGYMRLVRVRELVRSPLSWYHAEIWRSNVPFGEAMHWTRPLDALLALVALPLEPVIGASAVLVAGLVVPPLLLLASCVAAAWMVRPLVRDLHPAMTALFVLGQPLVVSYGLPGRADHHLLILLLAALVLGAAVRIAEGRNAIEAARFGGIAAALGIWVSTEALFAYGIATVLLGLPWLTESRESHWARVNARFHGWAALGLAAAILLERPYTQWLTLSLDRISAVHLILAMGLVLFWAFASGVRARGVRRRAALAAMGAAMLLTTLSAMAPGFAAGPFARVDPGLRTLWLSHVQEFLPVPWSPGRALAYFGAPLTAMVGLPLLLRPGSGGRRGVAVLAFPLLLASVMGVAQVRWLLYAQLIAAALLAVYVSRVRERLSESLPHRLLKALVVVIAATAWLVGGGVIDAFIHPAPRVADSVPACGERDVISALQGAGFSGPQVVAAHVDFGPAILFRTRDAVVAAPYHRNSGTLAVYQALNAVDPERARTILRARRVDLVVVCPGHDEPFFQKRVQGAETLFGHLAAGDPPPWLAPLPRGSGGAVLYQVRE